MASIWPRLLGSGPSPSRQSEETSDSLHCWLREGVYIHSIENVISLFSLPTELRPSVQRPRSETNNNRMLSVLSQAISETLRRIHESSSTKPAVAQPEEDTARPRCPGLEPPSLLLHIRAHSKTLRPSDVSNGSYFNVISRSPLSFSCLFPKLPHENRDVQREIDSVEVEGIWKVFLGVLDCPLP